MINKILATIDRSDRSQSVFDTAVSLAQSTGANLMLLHILSEEDPGYPILPAYAYYSVLKGSGDGIFQEQFNEYEQQEADFLRDLAQKAIAAGINTEYIQLSGIPGWEICEAASSWSADLILVGSRGLRGLKEMFVGSVSNYVTHHAPCSVLLVRTNTDLVPYTNVPLYELETEVNSKQEILNQNRSANKIIFVEN